MIVWPLTFSVLSECLETLMPEQAASLNLWIAALHPTFPATLHNRASVLTLLLTPLAVPSCLSVPLLPSFFLTVALLVIATLNLAMAF